jgi:hypothetical protein
MGETKDYNNPPIDLKPIYIFPLSFKSQLIVDYYGDQWVSSGDSKFYVGEKNHI